MEYYDYIKSLHLISIILWISMLIYFPRLLSHHLDALHFNNDVLVNSIKEEEKIIYRYIMSLAFVFAVISGIFLIVFNKALLSSGIWIYLKFFLISILAIIHHIYRIYMVKLNKNLLDIKVNKKRLNYLSYSSFIIISFICFLTIVKMI
jgi:putative membrane protein